MVDQIIETQSEELWWHSAPGQYVLNWQSIQFDRAVADLFGYHALQIGQPHLDTLRHNRMPHRWMGIHEFPRSFHVTGHEQATDDLKQPTLLFTESVALPFADASLDLVTLPNALENSLDPHATLREVERVLVPDGRLVIAGFNPISLWGWRQSVTKLPVLKLLSMAPFHPCQQEWIGYWRLRDWLKLLSLEVTRGGFGCYRPALTQQQWLDRWAWVEKAGDRWWPILGACYFLVAVKKVRGMRLLGSQWKRAPVRAVGQAATVHQATRPFVKSHGGPDGQ